MPTNLPENPADESPSLRLIRLILLSLVREATRTWFCKSCVPFFRCIATMIIIVWPCLWFGAASVLHVPAQVALCRPPDPTPHAAEVEERAIEANVT